MKPIVIAGNGPSLAQIDYARLPKDFDVFRCNQFYFEDRYFLGKKIKGVFYSLPVFKEQFFTLHHLKERGEYEVEDVYCNFDKNNQIRSRRYGTKSFEHYFPKVLNVIDYVQKMPDFNELDQYFKLYYDKEPTSAIYMLIVALAQGYREIYMTGIDFYIGGGIDYAFDIGGKKIGKMIPSFNRTNVKHLDFHGEEVDKSFIRLAMNMNGVNIYCLSSNSPLYELIPLAPIQNNAPMEILSKPEDCICDFVATFEPKNFKQFLDLHYSRYIKRGNLCLRIVDDLLAWMRLLKVPFKYIKIKIRP